MFPPGSLKINAIVLLKIIAFLLIAISNLKDEISEQKQTIYINRYMIVIGYKSESDLKKTITLRDK